MVDISYMSPQKDKFVTNVGLITTRGSKGDNIMAAEWTHHVSYSPGIIVVCIGSNKISADNIRQSKEFGVNLASSDQNIISSVAGGSHGAQVDKIAALKELGFKFADARKIKTLMVDGASMQAECKLVNEIQLGSHTMFVGEVIELYPANDKESLVYYKKKYWKPGDPILKPEMGKTEHIDSVVKKHHR